LGVLALLALVVGIPAAGFLTRVPTGIAYRILYRDGANLLRPEGLRAVSEARYWVMAQLVWNRPAAAKDVLVRLLDTGSVDLLLAPPPGDAPIAAGDLGQFLKALRDAAESIGDPSTRRELFRKLALAFARTGDPAAALDLAARFETLPDQLQVFRGI